MVLYLLCDVHIPSCRCYGGIYCVKIAGQFLNDFEDYILILIFLPHKFLPQNCFAFLCSDFKLIAEIFTYFSNSFFFKYGQQICLFNYFFFIFKRDCLKEVHMHRLHLFQSVGSYTVLFVILKKTTNKKIAVVF